MKVEVYQTRAGYWRFRIVHKNGQIANHHYNNKAAAVKAARQIIYGLGSAILEVKK